MTIKLYSYFLLVCCLLLTQNLKAQVTIGGNFKPNKGALLDLKEYDDNEAQNGGRTADKGLTLPRVEINNIKSLNDIHGSNTNDMESYTGLLIYNTIDKDFTEGCKREKYSKDIFVWMGDQWQALDSPITIEGEDISDNVDSFGSDGNIRWTLESDGTMTICGTGAMNNYTTKTMPWYSNISKIKKLIIKEGVTSIGNYAFNGCSNLEGILTLPNSVIVIGDRAFGACPKIGGTLIISDEVTSIGNSAFYGCVELTGLKIGNSVTYIGNSAFYGCNKLSGSLVIPDQVTTIGSTAFYGCKELDGTLIIGKSVQTIGNSAFYGCTQLTGGLVIPNQTTTIGSNAFNNCIGLSGTLTIGNAVVSIGASCFYGSVFSKINSNCTPNAYNKDLSIFAISGTTPSYTYISRTMYIPSTLKTSYDAQSTYWSATKITTATQ